MLTHLTKKPGEFRAVCRKGAWLPLDVLTAEELIDLDRRLAEAEARGEYTGSIQRWDRKLRLEVAVVECSLDTTDRDEYLAHVARFHPEMKAPRTPPRLRMWRGPQAAAEGTPVKPSTREIAKSLKTCERCGLVAEVNDIDTLATHRWWDEHLRMCAGTEAGAA